MKWYCEDEIKPNEIMYVGAQHSTWHNVSAS